MALSVKRNSRLKAEFHHHVYVVLLSNKAARHPSILRANPKRDPRKPCVYVGMSGLPPEHRFENHRHGYKSAWVVRKYDSAPANCRLLRSSGSLASKYWALYWPAGDVVAFV